jgi:uncharacterized protein
MANVTYPGVYVQEVSGGVKPIAAAGTSTAAFIGQAERGPVNVPTKVFSFTEYQNRFGSFLGESWLSHAVFQFFNNGGSQCYIVRVTGENPGEASIDLDDRASDTQTSLQITASSPGAWGNSLAIVISDGINDPHNEFNLSIFAQGERTPRERFTNLSVVPETSNYVDKVVAASKYVRVAYNVENPNAEHGTSRSGSQPQVPDPSATKFRININDDDFQTVDLRDGVGKSADQVSDLNSMVNIAKAIQLVVRRLSRQQSGTEPDAFEKFSCSSEEPGGELLLSSGVKGPMSSVRVLPAGGPEDDREDASGFLSLGILNGGVEVTGSSITRPQPKPDAASPSSYYLWGGSNGDAVSDDRPYIEALRSLDTISDVNLICIPGVGSHALVGAGMNYCASRPLSDCFFIGDMREVDDTVEDAKEFHARITPKNSYGAVYLPWLRMVDPTGQSAEPILVPPSGYVAGLYARADAQRGVWKAPAGTAAAVAGAVGLAVSLTDVQQGNLNDININVIRHFAGSGTVLWGARTVTSDPEWQYIPVRRMAIMLRVSIYNGIQWAVFEPNDEPLWASLRLNIGSFMMNLFRRGAFQGNTPAQAFFVKCDSETTTQADVDLGIVNVLVGFAPLKPAEFVVVKISQKAGQASS